jgi:hypothetical protein
MRPPIHHSGAARSIGAGADPQHDSHLARDGAHRREVEPADDLADLGEAVRLWPVGHHLRCQPQAVLRCWRDVDPQADIRTHPRGDRQHRRLGKPREEVRTDDNSRRRLVAWQPDQDHCASADGGYRHPSVCPARRAKPRAMASSSGVSWARRRHSSARRARYGGSFTSGSHSTTGRNPCSRWAARWRAIRSREEARDSMRYT